MAGRPTVAGRPLRDRSVSNTAGLTAFRYLASEQTALATV